jgi:7-keto-8-aminopelargonate synthetase-like enzyme
MADLKAIELRLKAILDPYRDRLESATIYNMPVLRKPGAKAHDWFAGVQPTEAAVKFNFLPMHTHPTLVAGVSPALRKRKTGASVFQLTEMDEPLFKELESLVARGFEAYMAGARTDP